MKNNTIAIEYTELPLDENGDFDVDSFDNQQLDDFYYDYPEAMPDVV